MFFLFIHSFEVQIREKCAFSHILSLSFFSSLCVYFATVRCLRINLEYLEVCVCVLTFGVCVFFIIRVCSHQPVLMFYFIAVHTMLDCTCQTLEHSQCLLCASAHTTYIPVCN